MRSILTRLTILSLGFILVGCSGMDMSSSSGDPGANGDAPASFTRFNDIPLPSGASMDMDRTLLLGNAEEWTGRLVYTTSENTATVYDLYRSDMPKFGWSELSAVRSERSFLSFRRGARVATVEIQARTLWGARVSVTMAPVGGTATGGSYRGSTGSGYQGSGGSTYRGGSSSGGVTRTPLN